MRNGHYIPLVYALLNGKSEDKYRSFWNDLLTICTERNLQLKPSIIHVDFEQAMHPNLPLSLRLKASGCHYNNIYNNTWTKQVKQLSKQHQTQWSKCQRHFYVTYWKQNIFDIFVDTLSLYIFTIWKSIGIWRQWSNQY
jgi:hypothetical protein